MRLAMAWEEEFVRILKEFEGENITVNFMAEVSGRGLREMVGGVLWVVRC